MEWVIARRGAAKKSCQDGHDEKLAGESDYGFESIQKKSRVTVYVTGYSRDCNDVMLLQVFLRKLKRRYSYWHYSRLIAYGSTVGTLAVDRKIATPEPDHDHMFSRLPYKGRIISFHNPFKDRKDSTIGNTVFDEMSNGGIALIKEDLEWCSISSVHREVQLCQACLNRTVTPSPSGISGNLNLVIRGRKSTIIGQETRHRLQDLVLTFNHRPIWLPKHRNPFACRIALVVANKVF